MASPEEKLIIGLQLNSKIRSLSDSISSGKISDFCFPSFVLSALFLYIYNIILNTNWNYKYKYIKLTSRRTQPTHIRIG
jgi:hypothetical protein